MSTRRRISKMLTIDRIIVMLILILSTTFASFLPAQDLGSDIDTDQIELSGIFDETVSNGEEDENSIFNIDTIFDEDLLNDEPDLITEDSLSEELEIGLLKEGYTIGGELSSKFTGSFTWDDYPCIGDLGEPDEINAKGFALAGISIDFRRDKDYRVFGKLETYYPYNHPPWGAGVNFRIIELFSDFHWKNQIYFRFGKQLLKWGVGQVFNVADIFERDPVYFTDPDGLLALKANIPFGNNNLYFYTTMNDESKAFSKTAFADITHALQYEFLLGNFESSIGAAFSYERVPKGVITVSGSLGKLGITAESRVSYGSDRIFLDEQLDAYHQKHLVFFDFDLGVFYRFTEKHLGIDWSFYEQVLYYGQGYGNTNTLRLKEVRRRRKMEIDDPDRFSGLELSPYYKYYNAVSFKWNKVFNTDWTFNTFWKTNFIDWSGSIDCNVTYPFFNRFMLDIGLNVNYGSDTSEVILDRENRFALTLGLAIGGGKF